DIELIPKNTILNSIKDAFLYCKDLGSSFRSAEILRSGYFVAIAGYPNSGKSTLFNALLQRKRAIVSELPGTTRDYLEETLIINGLAIKLIDTAGLRSTDNIIEIEGIKLVESVLEQSNLICIINDLSISPDHSNKLLKKIRNNYARAKVILLQNKIDLVPPSEREILNDIQHPEIKISAKNKIGIDILNDFLYTEAHQSTERINDILINQRHSRLLWQASRELGNAMESLKSGMENEIISIDVRAAIKTLGEVIGETWNEDVLNNIFSRFCIGK
ncbi:MAG: GTP-binding protein, partial [FCB group bacterium]